MRGGHPEHREWGAAPMPQRYGDWQGGPGAQGGPSRVPGPRREFVQAFEAPSTEREREPEYAPIVPAPGPETAKGGKGRAFTGIAAAAVTTVLAVVVAGQVASGSGTSHTDAQSSATGRGDSSAASRGEHRATPEAAALLTYDQKMAKQYPLDAKLTASGDFATVPGAAKAPGAGRKYRYRVDVEKGLGLDGALFAEAIQKTLNDNRSWAHNGAKTFERISTGTPDFVITLASPGTTAKWCMKSQLDTAEENVSCDSAATERVMINAYRWAQGSDTYGADKMFLYRQMLINHEVGHRLGHSHVNCTTPGALAPVMQQQTKSLDIGGIKCKANPWVYPTS
ncbi:DUF3152 domain-containing protein [Streptomyces sp. NPDC050738]|uniref:DUF3152 domain-containing protein n=1 Tax=Streptomyces sp. NPDC050738 TaxID=3154744 RepID=UPI00343714BD